MFLIFPSSFRILTHQRNGCPISLVLSFPMFIFPLLLTTLFQSMLGLLQFLFTHQHLPIYLLSHCHRHLLVFHSIGPLNTINHWCTNLFLHQLSTHIIIHILFFHLSNPYSICTLMYFPNMTSPSIYLNHLSSPRLSIHQTNTLQLAFDKDPFNNLF